jgi:RimJ/RimL family protein N-acetyltransferase
MTLPDITTERLRLARWDPDAHTPALAAINAEPAAVEYVNAGVPFTYAESEGQSVRFGAHWERFGFGLYAVEVQSSGEVIGFTGPAHPLWFPPLADEVEIGWRLHPSAWGSGYATEAARAAVDAAFTHLGVHEVIAIIDPANAPSIAVATRIGMHASRAPGHQHRGAVAIYARGV